jgi:LacI family transcriptional regulator
MRDRCDGAEALIRAEGLLAFRVRNAFSVDLEPEARTAITTGGATAVFAAADVIAIGALRHAQASGLRVPEDLSVLGFDDIPLAEQSLPSLSTIELPVEEMAERALSMLAERIAAPRPHDAEIFRIGTGLVPRASVAFLT